MSETDAVALSRAAAIVRGAHPELADHVERVATTLAATPSAADLAAHLTREFAGVLRTQPREIPGMPGLRAPVEEVVRQLVAVALTAIHASEAGPGRGDLAALRDWLACLDVEADSCPPAAVLQDITAALAQRDRGVAVAQRVPGLVRERDALRATRRQTAAQLRGKLYAALIDGGPLVRYGVLNRWRPLDAPEAEKLAALVAPVLAANTPAATMGGDLAAQDRRATGSLAAAYRRGYRTGCAEILGEEPGDVVIVVPDDLAVPASAAATPEGEELIENRSPCYENQDGIRRHRWSGSACWNCDARRYVPESSREQGAAAGPTEGRCQRCGNVVRLVTESHLVNVDQDGDGGECEGSDSEQWEYPHALPATSWVEGVAAAGGFEVETPPADTRPDAVLATALGRVGAAQTVDAALSLCDRVTRELDRFDMVVAARPDLAMNTPGTGTSAADRRRVYAALRDLLDEDDHGLPPGAADAVIRLTSKAMLRTLAKPVATPPAEGGELAEVVAAFDEALGCCPNGGVERRGERALALLRAHRCVRSNADAVNGLKAVTTAEVITWHRARFGGDPADVLVMGKLAEEAGEVCGAITKRAEGAIRPAKGLVTHEDWSRHLLDEVGDVGIVLHTLCAREGTTLDEVVTRRFRDDVSLRTGQERPRPGSDPRGEDIEDFDRRARGGAR